MILVLNAGGNIGKELARQLHEQAVPFTAAFRSAEQVHAAESAGMRAVTADFGKPETLAAAFEGIRSAFVVSPPALNLVELETNVLNAAKAAGVQHLVKLSVWGADSGEIAFGKPHYEVEKAIEASGVPYTFLRPTGFMQNILSSAPTIKAQGAFYMPTADARIAEIDYRDIARVAAAALTLDGHLGKVYELTGPEAMNNTQRAEILSEVLGKPVHYVPLSDADWKSAVMGAGVPEWQADGVIDLAHYYRAGKSERVSPAVEQVTGVKPKTYMEFAHDYADALR